MCFNINSDYPEAQTAETDIICYKVLEKDDDTLVSPYEKELYFKKGNTVIKEVKDFGIKDNKIFEGLHSFSSLTSALKSIEIIKEEFYISDFFIHKISDFFIHKAIIPKKTKYYYNPLTEEYVSLKLKVWRKALEKI